MSKVDNLVQFLNLELQSLLIKQMLLICFFNKLTNLLICFDSIFKVLATTSVEVFRAILTISKIACLEYCFKGMQKSGKTACVELQFLQISLGTEILIFIKILSILKITFLEYEEEKQSRQVFAHLGHFSDRKLSADRIHD